MMPRERLVKYGAESLSLADLFAIILGSGTKEENVFLLANRIVGATDSLSDLLDLTLNELENIKGIKKAKATKVLASIELAKRIFNYKSDNIQLKDANSLFGYLKSYYLGKKYEEFIVLYFDNQMRLIKLLPLSSGDNAKVTFNYTNMFKYAFKYDSNYIIIAHNHPSGLAIPSKEDHLITKQVFKQASEMGINLMDHLIIGDNDYYSFAANSKLN